MTDISFIEKLEGLREQSRLEEGNPSAIYSSLFKRISPENFRRIINHAIRNYNTYKDGNYHYVEKSPIGANIHDPYFLACTYEIYRHDNGELALMIQTKSKTSTLSVDETGKLIQRTKTHINKPRGTMKTGSTSFCVDANGITEFFTLVGRGPSSIKNIQKEQKILSQFNNPFIVKPLFGNPRDKRNRRSRISLSAPKAVCDGEKISFSNFTDLLVGINSLALGMQAISQARIIYQDLKLPNILLMPNGIIKITDFGLAIPQDHNNSDHINGSCMAPEVLASIVAEQKKRLVLDDQDSKTLEQLSLVEQVNWINEFVREKGLTATSRYSYHFLQNLDYNTKAMNIWDSWKAEDRQNIKLANPQQDMWSFGATLLSLLENQHYTPVNGTEKEFLFKLKKLIETEIINAPPATIINAPPATRLSIKQFIGKFNILLKQSKILNKEQVDLRIKEHIDEFFKAQPESKIDRSTETKASTSTTTVPTATVTAPSKPGISSAPAELKQAKPALRVSATQPETDLPSEIKNFLDYHKEINNKCNTNGLSKALINCSLFTENRFAKRDLAEKIGRIVTKYGRDINTGAAQTEIDNLIIQHIQIVGNNNLGSVLRNLSKKYRYYCEMSVKTESFADYVKGKRSRDDQVLRTQIQYIAKEHENNISTKEAQAAIDHTIIGHIREYGNHNRSPVLNGASKNYKKYVEFCKQKNMIVSFADYVKNEGSVSHPSLAPRAGF